MVLNDALAREVAKGWKMTRRWKLHAVIGKITTTWRGREEFHVREVRLDASGKVISTKLVDEGERGPEFNTAVGPVIGLDLRETYIPCVYCRRTKLHNNCNAGAFVLFP